jgi:hypothetical protein
VIGAFDSHIQYNEAGSQHPLQHDNRVDLQDGNVTEVLTLCTMLYGRHIYLEGD